MSSSCSSRIGGLLWCVSGLTAELLWPDEVGWLSYETLKTQAVMPGLGREKILSTVRYGDFWCCHEARGFTTDLPVLERTKQGQFPGD